MCSESKQSGADAPVPDFSVLGFDSSRTSLAEAHTKIKDLLALRLQVCVGASYDPATNKICFTIPIYGDLCVTSPVHIPIGGSLKACAETCGAILPTGLKATIYLNGNSIYSGTLVGSC
jgi:hypothetical protein